MVIKSEIVEVAKEVAAMEESKTLTRDFGINNPVFVFGSNLAGRHGKGAALCAMKDHGAIYGQGVGMQGHSYAIPTKDHQLKTLPLEMIKKYVDDFLSFAGEHPDWHFHVTAIGCGLAGYGPWDIAPMFNEAPYNCDLPDEFLDVLRDPIQAENGIESLFCGYY